MSKIELKKVSKSYGKNQPVIENLDLTIENGSFTILLGPSGCGKSTILRMIAGLESVTEGTVTMNGEDMREVDPGKRQAAMVFQNYALYPTMTVRENIEFGLKNMKIPKEEREMRIAESIRMVNLEDFLDRRPRQLSGGQCQRVALARAIVKKPRVFLMDEPLSNLDAKLRMQIRADLIELHRRLGITFVYVTHDQVEAMSMGTEIVLLEAGKIRQQDKPEKLYHAPDNLFAARFIGSPAMNILPGELCPAASLPEGARFIGFRPEKTRILNNAGILPKNAVSLKGELIAREMLGDYTLYKIKTEGGDIYAKETEGGACCTYGPVEVFVRGEDLLSFDAGEKRIF